MAKNLDYQPVILGMEHGVTYYGEKASIQDWLTVEISEWEIETYPNAKEAHKIKNSKLYRSLK